MDTERDWISDGKYSYDPSRWNPEERPSNCQVCGTWLSGAGDGSTVGQHCDKCGVLVWVA